MSPDEEVGMIDDATVRTHRAPWLDLPDIVADVEELRVAYSRDELCVATELCDRHPSGDTAFIVVDRDAQAQSLTFGELAERSRRLASGLQAAGIVEGSRVGVLMTKTAQLPVVLLALWRLGAVHVPLFTAFAGPAILQRLEASGARLVVADPDQLEKLIDVDLPVLTAGTQIDDLIDAHSPLATDIAIGSGGTFVEIYTSGTTGKPKGVEVNAFAIASTVAYMRYGLDVRGDDVFWNMADPGWAYGLYYGVIGPLATGRANILLTSGFDVELTRRVIDDLGVTNLAAAPTVYRALRAAGITVRQPLRAASAAGEPLTPEVVEWAPTAIGTTVRDHWGQTEQGMAIANAWNPLLRRDVEDGSMGQSLPGFVGGTVGASIALSVDESPLMWFSGYVNAPEQTAERFTPDGAWYLTGDIGRESEGNFFFASREDDVILSAGYRIAPFDIERILVTSPHVRDAAVVGRPDEIRGTAVEAFVVLTSHPPVDGLEKQLQDMVRGSYGVHAYPRRVRVVRDLPRTASGKVQRFILRDASDEELSAWEVDS